MRRTREIQIAQRGKPDRGGRDRAVGAGRVARSLFFPQTSVSRTTAAVHGFLPAGPAAGTVVDQFPHLYPTAIAIGYSVEGLTGARDVGLIAAALGVLAL